MPAIYLPDSYVPDDIAKLAGYEGAVLTLISQAGLHAVYKAKVGIRGGGDKKLKLILKASEDPDALFNAERATQRLLDDLPDGSPSPLTGIVPRVLSVNVGQVRKMKQLDRAEHKQVWKARGVLTEMRLPAKKSLKDFTMDSRHFAGTTAQEKVIREIGAAMRLLHAHGAQFFANSIYSASDEPVQFETFAEQMAELRDRFVHAPFKKFIGSAPSYNEAEMQLRRAALGKVDGLEILDRPSLLQGKMNKNNILIDGYEIKNEKIGGRTQPIVKGIPGLGGIIDFDQAYFGPWAADVARFFEETGLDHDSKTTRKLRTAFWDGYGPEFAKPYKTVESTMQAFVKIHAVMSLDPRKAIDVLKRDGTLSDELA